MLFQETRKISRGSKKMPAADIFILDDEIHVRDSLRLILKEGGYNAVCFADSVSLLQAVRQRCPAGILLDLNLPGRSGLEVLKQLATYKAPVCMISGCGDITTAVIALKEGASDFMQKPFTRQGILDKLAEMIPNRSGTSGTAVQQKIASSHFPGKRPFTRRERAVLQLVATGMSSKDIADKLGISHRTVEDHRSNLMQKIGAKNVVELVTAVLA